MPYLSPPTLTQAEQRAVLQAIARHARDDAIVSLALGTGLRVSEIVGLDVADAFTPNGQPKSRVRIRAEIAKGGRGADVFLPTRLVPKLRALWRFKRGRGESLEPDAPLFCSQSRRRLSVRWVQTAWASWQREAGLDPTYPFHALRHTAVTNVYRATRDLFLAQRFARHASPLTTTVYTHPGDQETQRAVAGLWC